MMDDEKWKKLYEAFQEEEPFWEDNYADESAFDGLHLYSWLECSGARPAADMVREYSRHGYDVFPVEKDSFGWLIGGIRRHLDPQNKVITFG